MIIFYTTSKEFSIKNKNILKRQKTCRFLLYYSVEGGEIMKSANVLRLYIDLVEEKKD